MGNTIPLPQNPTVYDAFVLYQSKTKLRCKRIPNRPEKVTITAKIIEKERVSAPNIQEQNPKRDYHPACTKNSMQLHWDHLEIHIKFNQTANSLQQTMGKAKLFSDA